MVSSLTEYEKYFKRHTHTFSAHTQTVQATVSKLSLRRAKCHLGSRSMLLLKLKCNGRDSKTANKQTLSSIYGVFCALCFCAR